ncbi:hypothetical protein GCM10007962_15210 [Yeosuana aromativorans]|uniref:Uncharacterized protein n=1 Tax=Yeosuana aromativorans TaxID=288019 RepID=A0A8J3FGG2_9FLAO|nr:hypothetical protein GCM10007962_15210 [Yeosuana aromativorans]
MYVVYVVLEFFGKGYGTLNICELALGFSKIDPGYFRNVDDIAFMDPFEMIRQLVLIGFQGFESRDDFPVQHMEIRGVIVSF